MRIERAHRVIVNVDKGVVKTFWVTSLPLPAALVAMIRGNSSESVTCLPRTALGGLCDL